MMNLPWRRLIGAWALSILATLATAGQAPYEVARSEPASPWDARFKTTDGWIGGDGAYSALLGPDRVLWLFGDTLWGHVENGGRSGTTFVNNTIAIQTGQGDDAHLRFIAGPQKDGKPTSLWKPADSNGWFWPQGAVRVKDQLILFFPQIDKTSDPGVFGFKQIGQWLMIIDNPDEDPANWHAVQHRVPFCTFGPHAEQSWGSAVLVDGLYLYIYGFDDKKKGLGTRNLVVARAPADKPEDFTKWKFRAAEGWSDKPAEAAPLAGGLAPELSVTPFNDGFALVYTESGLSDKIVGRFAKTPEGPWSEPLLLCKTPEMGADKGIFTYSAKAHAWAAKKNELFISYCNNTWDFGRLFKDQAVYRPKFVSVELKATQSN